jgi:hypothetical protein
VILNANRSPQKFARAFQRWTRVSFQVRGGNTLFVSKDQGEAANQNDGLQLTQASTNPPYDCWWKGDLWFSANNDNSGLIMEVIGIADESFHP